MIIMQAMLKIRVDDCAAHTTGDPEQDEEFMCIGGMVQFTIFTGGMGSKPWREIGTLRIDLDEFEDFCKALESKFKVIYDQDKLNKFLDANPGIL